MPAGSRPGGSSVLAAVRISGLMRASRLSATSSLVIASVMKSLPYSSVALRHTAAYRMAEDPALSLPDVILSFRVSRGCDLRRPVVDSVADGTLAA